MSGTRQPAAAPLATKLDDLVETHEQRVAALVEELAHARQKVDQYRELRTLLDQVLADSVAKPGPDDLADPPSEEQYDESSMPRPTALAGVVGTLTRSEVPHPNTPSEATDLPIDEVRQAMKARAGQIMSTRDVLALFPSASRIQVSDRLGRLVRQGKLTRVDKGHFRFDAPAATTTPAAAPSFASTQDQPDELSGMTLRAQITTVMEQDPGRGWWPRDLIDVLRPKRHDYLRATLREMAGGNRLVQDDAGRYWLPRPSALVVGLADDDRRVSMA